jgi:hypothetical protein
MVVKFYQGVNTYAIYAAETSYGAGASLSGSNKIGKVTSINYLMNQGFFRSQSMGDGRNATVAVTGAFDISGSMDFDVDDFTFMQYVVGTIGGAGTAADPYELRELDNIGYDATNIKTIALQFGCEADSNDDVQTITGVVLDKLTITATQGEIIKGSVDFIGKTITTSTSLTAYTPSTTRPFVFHQGNVTVGTDSMACTSFAITISNNIQTYRNINDRFIAQPVTGLRRYDFTMTMRKKYDSTAGQLSTTELRDLFYGTSNTPTTSAIVTSYAVSLDITEGASAGHRVANIDLENCYFESWSEPIALEEGVIECTISGFGLAGLTDGSYKVPCRWYTIS